MTGRWLTPKCAVPTRSPNSATPRTTSSPPRPRPQQVDALERSARTEDGNPGARGSPTRNGSAVDRRPRPRGFSEPPGQQLRQHREPGPRCRHRTDSRQPNYAGRCPNNGARTTTRTEETDDDAPAQARRLHAVEGRELRPPRRLRPRRTAGDDRARADLDRQPPSRPHAVVLERALFLNGYRRLFTTPEEAYDIDAPRSEDGRTWLDMPQARLRATRIRLPDGVPEADSKSWPAKAERIEIDISWTLNGATTRKTLKTDLAFGRADVKDPRFAYPFVTRGSAISRPTPEELILVAYSGTGDDEPDAEELTRDRAAARAAAEIALNADGWLTAVSCLATERLLYCLPADVEPPDGIRILLHDEPSAPVKTESYRRNDPLRKSIETDPRVARERNNRLVYESVTAELCSGRRWSRTRSCGGRWSRCTTSAAGSGRRPRAPGRPQPLDLHHADGQRIATSRRGRRRTRRDTYIYSGDLAAGEPRLPRCTAIIALTAILAIPQADGTTVHSETHFSWTTRPETVLGRPGPTTNSTSRWARRRMGSAPDERKHAPPPPVSGLDRAEPTVEPKPSTLPAQTPTLIHAPRVSRPRRRRSRVVEENSDILRGRGRPTGSGVKKPTAPSRRTPKPGRDHAGDPNRLTLRTATSSRSPERSAANRARGLGEPVGGIQTRSKGRSGPARLRLTR